MSEGGGIMDKVKEKAIEKLSNVEKPSCDLSDIDLKDASKQDVTLLSKLTVKNPYDHHLPLVRVTYKVLSAGRELGNGELTDTGDIKANDETTLELPTKVAYKFLWNLMKDIGADWDIDYNIEVGVEVKLPIVGKHTLPLHKRGTFALPKFSDFF